MKRDLDRLLLKAGKALNEKEYSITPILGRHSFTSSTTMSNIGWSIDIPANSYVCVTATVVYNYNKPAAVSVECTNCGQWAEGAVANNNASATLCVYLEEADTIQIRAKYAGAGSNYANIIGFYITLNQ